MKLILEEHINAAVEKINLLTEKDIDVFVERFKKAQPALFVYLLAVGDDELDDEENEALFFTGLVIWYATELAGANVPEVSEKTVEEIDLQNCELVENFITDDEEEVAIDFEELVQSHEQPNLIEFSLITAMDDETISNSSSGTIFICLKTFIECLHKQGSFA